MFLCVVLCGACRFYVFFVCAVYFMMCALSVVLGVVLFNGLCCVLCSCCLCSALSCVVSACLLLSYVVLLWFVCYGLCVVFCVVLFVCCVLWFVFCVLSCGLKFRICDSCVVCSVSCLCVVYCVFRVVLCALWFVDCVL